MASSIDLSKRQFLKGAATTGVGMLLVESAIVSTGCGPSKEKAVRVAGFIIDLAKESLPLLDLLGAHGIVETVSNQVLPALEKLKTALANTDIPAAGTTLTTVRNGLTAVANALLNLPESPRRTTIIGILASINVLLLTVQAFVESEMATGTSRMAALNAPQTGEKMLRVFEATRR